MKFSKTTATVYKLHDLGSSNWANFTVEETGEHSGRIQIASDWGAWQYYWSSCGSSFKQFLTKLGIDYVADKFNQDRYFDFEATIKRFRRDVIVSRRYDGKSKEEARELWENIDALEESKVSDFYWQVQGFANLWNINGGDIDVDYDIDPMFKAFWKKAWLPFIEIIKEEIAAESEVALSV